MFNDIKELYPTPKPVIGRMLKPYLTYEGHYHNFDKLKLGRGRYKANIFDPQAGRADILDYIAEKDFRHNHNLYAVEVEPDLQAIIRKKKHRLIGTDFLEFQTDLLFDLIIMNPPFSTGSKHFLKAWNILKTGHLCCLLNKKTYENSESKKYQLIRRIIKDHNGEAEDFGRCFKGSARTTDVEIVCLRVRKEEKPTYFFDSTNFQHLSRDRVKFVTEVQESEIVIADTLQALEDRYNASIQAFKEIITAMQKFRYYAKDSLVNYADKSIEFAEENDVNGFIEYFNSSCWNKVLNETKFKDIMTMKVKNEFMGLFNAQKDLAFTKANMEILFEVMFYKKGEILNDCIVEVFDQFTENHKDNRGHYEGWKTNDAYRVNRRVIMPNMIKATYSYGYKVQNELKCNDIDKAMCYLSGKKLSDLVKEEKTITETVKGTKKSGVLLESEFFELRFYQKGTMHFKFKDEALWRRFNITAGKLKGFNLPNNDGQSFYREREHNQQKKQTNENSQQLTLL